MSRPVDPPVIEPHSDMMSRTISPKKRVSMAKYMPITLTKGKATAAATAVEASPARGKAAQKGRLSFIIRMADVYPPMPAKAMVPMLI